LLVSFIPSISQVKIQQQLMKQHNLIKSLSYGKPAPDFQSTALNKDSFSLADFKGRYIVMDVWATWCVPCKIESPNFERLAEQYTGPKLAFVALSIDDNLNSWRSQASDRSSRVLQLIANDKNIFGNSFGIETIPRFMLIGPDGKIINIQMPYPSDPEFDAMLKREVSGLAAN
jgi:thiol-disulfide isomerase/thioredoxin